MISRPPRSALFKLSALAVLVALLLWGCGSPQSISRGTAEATGKAFVEAMEAGDYESVAKGFDYQAYARRENPDWDTFGEAQRQLIIGKLQEDKAAEMRALSGMFTGEVTVAEVAEREGRAQATVNAGASVLVLHMARMGESWYLRRIEEGTAL